MKALLFGIGRVAFELKTCDIGHEGSKHHGGMPYAHALGLAVCEHEHATFFKVTRSTGPYLWEILKYTNTIRSAAGLVLCSCVEHL